MRNNHSRALHEVVSIDAWHSTPNEDGAHSLHVDVSFRQSKVGEDPDAKVRFNLGIRRAELSFIIPDNEDIRVIQSSVAREAAAVGTIEVTSLHSSGSSANAQADAALSLQPSASAKLAASTSLSSAKSTKSTLTKSFSEINWTQFKDSTGSYSWAVYSADKSPMIGKPWNAVEQPRLKFRSRTDAKLSPVSRIVARCRREDLIIDSIEPKDSHKFSLTDRFAKNKMAAAEAILKVLLETGELDHSDISEKLSTILIGETPVDEEVR